MDVKEPLDFLETSTILSDLQELELLKASLSLTEELKSRQSYLKEIGCGLQFGFYHLTTSTETGLPQEKSIFWNQEEMTLHILLVAQTHSDLLFIGELTGAKTNMQRHIKPTSIPNLCLMTSTPMDYTGIQRLFTLTSILLATLFYLLISLKKVSSKEDNSLLLLTTLG